MIRKHIIRSLKEVSREEASDYAASEFRRIQGRYGRDAVGGITSSRCTNEETWLVQKLVRAAFGNNNVDTCARVCHSPTGYGLRARRWANPPARRRSIRSCTRMSVIVIGANPSSAPSGRSHSRLQDAACARARRSSSIDPRRIELVSLAAHPGRLPPAGAARHQHRAAVLAGARDRHRGPDRRRASSRSAAKSESSRNGASFRHRCSRIRPKRWRKSPACRRRPCAAPRGCMPPAATAPSTTAWA